jgi:hypothetical protein
MQNVTEVMNAMHALSYDDLLRLNRLAINLIKDKQRLNTYKFSVGDRVTFEGRGGIRWTGHVSKILSRNIQVACDSPSTMRWTVTSTMLERVGA